MFRLIFCYASRMVDMGKFRLSGLSAGVLVSLLVHGLLVAALAGMIAGAQAELWLARRGVTGEVRT